MFFPLIQPISVQNFLSLLLYFPPHPNMHNLSLLYLYILCYKFHQNFIYFSSIFHHFLSFIFFLQKQTHNDNNKSAKKPKTTQQQKQNQNTARTKDNFIKFCRLFNLFYHNFHTQIFLFQDNLKFISQTLISKDISELQLKHEQKFSLTQNKTQ